MVQGAVLPVPIQHRRRLGPVGLEPVATAWDRHRPGAPACAAGQPAEDLASDTSKNNAKSIFRRFSPSRAVTPRPEERCGPPSKITPSASAWPVRPGPPHDLVIHQVAGFITAFALRPTGVARFTASRSDHRWQTWAAETLGEQRALCALPAPGGPRRRISMSVRSRVRRGKGRGLRTRSQSSVSVLPTHNSTCTAVAAPERSVRSQRSCRTSAGPVLFNLGQSIEQHADHDQDRGRAELLLEAQLCEEVGTRQAARTAPAASPAPEPCRCNRRCWSPASRPE